MSVHVHAISVCICYLLSPTAPGDPVGKTLEGYWAELASTDATLAFKAMGEMIARPKETVAFLGSKVEPIPAVDAATIEKLVAELDSANFAARQKATMELEKLQGLARPALEKMLIKPPSAEAQGRGKKLLEQLEGPVSSPDELRQIRAVEVLERIDTAAARDLMARLAKGAPGTRLTMEAGESLTRMKKTHSP